MGRGATRVAVVQLDCHPAAVLPGSPDPLEDPLFEGDDETLPTPGAVAEALADPIRALRARVRKAYCGQLLSKVAAILEACRGWGVQLVVFPEYSIPWQILDGVAAASSELVVVAGTHAVTRAARNDGVYQRLGGSAPPALEAVAPVLYGGKLLALTSKMHAARPEQGALRESERWSTIALPPDLGLPSPLGVVICLDFLVAPGAEPDAITREKLQQARLLAVPSWTPTRTLREFEAVAWVSAARGRTPVLYANVAAQGGSTVYVDKGRPQDASRFPQQLGRLDAGDEGVVVVDIDLRDQRRGTATPYLDQPIVTPVALASLVYRSHPAGEAYSAWLERMAPALARGDGGLDEVIAAIQGEAAVLRAAGSLPGAAARGLRLRSLMNYPEGLNRVEDAACRLREVVLPAGAIPHRFVRAAMAHGAAQAIDDLLGDRALRGHQGELVPLRDRLQAGGKPAVHPTPAEWTERGREALMEIAASVRGDVPVAPAPVVRIEPRRLPAEIDPIALADRTITVDRDRRELVFRARARDVVVALYRSRDHDGEDRRQWGRVRSGASDVVALDRLVSLLRAEGATQLAVVGLGPSARERAVLSHPDTQRALGVLSQQVGPAKPYEIAPLAPLAVLARVAGDCRLYRIDVGAARQANGVRSWSPSEVAALEAELRVLGLGDQAWIDVSVEEIAGRIAALRPMLEGAREVIVGLRDRRLQEVGGHYVDPDVAIGDQVEPARDALDRWLAPDSAPDGARGTPIALVLGEFGAGKSTLLADWCLHRWRDHGDGPRPILVDLAGAGEQADAPTLILSGCRLADTPAHRAALTLLIADDHAVPCFDGFDEMATRVEASALAGRLAALTSVVTDGGHAVVSSRSHYFPTARAEQEVERALASSLAHSAPHSRMEVQAFNEAKVARLVTEVAGATRAPELLRRIQTTYDLRDLAKRPLLLAMVLQTVEQLPPDKRVTQAVLYEQYLARWLANTHHTGQAEAFTDLEKRAFAETLGEALWRTGASSLGWEALEDTVRAHLFPKLPQGVPAGAALLEIAGGAFFVREGDDRYRFAHKSFLEYFFARALVRGLDGGSTRGLDTRPLSKEVVAFVHEVLLLEASEAPQRHPAVIEVQRWLTTGRSHEGEPAATARSAANAVRLLHGLAREARTSGWLPDGADLRGVRLDGEDLSGIELRQARLDGASLRATQLVSAVLDAASLAHSALDEAVLDGASLADARAPGASFVRASARAADLRRADLQGAQLAQSQWVACDWADACLTGARAECAVFVGAGAPASELTELLVQPLAGHQGWVESVAWHGDGTRLASAGSDGMVRVWDASTYAELARLEGHQGDVTSVVWHGDGTRLASAGSDGMVRVWDASTYAELARLEGHQGDVTSVAWHGDGTRLASAGHDGTVRVWDASTYAELARLEGHQGDVTSVAWHGDGTRLASAGGDGTVRVWDASTYAELARLEGHQDAVRSVAWHKNGTQLASAGHDGTVRVWDASTYAELARLEGHQDDVTSVAWHGDGTRLASAGIDGTVRVWDASTYAELARLEGHQHGVTSVALHGDGDGTRLASAGNGTVRVWDASTYAELARLEGHQHGVTSVALHGNGDGTRLASAGHDGTVRVWDASTYAELARLKGHQNGVRSVAWHGDGTRLASAGNDGTVRVWDASTYAELARLEGHQSEVTCVAWHEDGTLLASAGNDETVRVWDASTYTELARLEGHQDWVESVAWRGDGTRLASAGADGAVRVWDASTYAELARLEGHQGGVTSVAWHEDGTRLASSGNDGTVRVWDASTCAELARLEGNQDGVTCVAWHKNGTRLASAGDDGTVRVWDASTYAELARLEGHQDWVTSVAWHKNGTRLASAGQDGTVRVWDIGNFGVPNAVQSVIAITLSVRGWFAAIPSGYVRIVAAEDRIPLRLEARSPQAPGAARFLPLGALRLFFDRPDLVARSLAGERIATTPTSDLRAAGWTPTARPEGSLAYAFDQAAPIASVIAAVTASARLDAPTFVPGPAITDGRALEGRAALVDELVRLTAARAPTALLGPRRAGKTSLLHTLAARLRDTHEVHHATLEGAQLASRDDLARRLAPELAGHAAPAEALLQARSDRPTVYLIDELAWLQRLPADHLAWLRALGQDAAMLVLAGSRQDWRNVAAHARTAPGSSFANDVSVVEVGPLAPHDAIRFLTSTSAGQISDDLARLLVEECGGWPFYLQVMGFAVEQEQRVGRAVVVREQVRDLRHRRLIIDRDPVFAGRWEELPPLARATLLAHRDQLPPIDDLTIDAADSVIGAGLASPAGTWLDDIPWFQWIRLHARRLARQEGV